MKGASPLNQSEIEAHNEMVATLWEDFGRGANQRVPIVFATDEALWLARTGHTFRQFYTDPRVQLHVQLEGQAWFADTIVHDQRFGPPAEAWAMTPRFWMEEPEFFGCEVVIQEDSFAWSKPLAGSKAELIRRLTDLDPAERVQQGRLWQLYTAMKDLCEGLTWRDLPVHVGFPGGGTHGVFTIACHVRGAETLCLDLLEDPDFATEFLGLITDKTLERVKAWHGLAETGVTLPQAGWGMADDSLQFISAGAYRRFVLPHHQRLYSALTTGQRSMHLCGHSQQHFETLYESLGVTVLDGPGTFVDHGALLAAFPRLQINAQADHTRLLLGPPEDIEEMMREMLTDGVFCNRQPGRFQVMGFLGPQTPLSHVQAMYDAGRRYGG